MSSIEAAIAAIEPLEPGEKFSYRKIAKLYGCNCTMLAWRHQHHSTMYSLEAQNHQALHPQQEKELPCYIKRLTRQGLPPM
jgi:transposase-like protein